MNTPLALVAVLLTGCLPAKSVALVEGYCTNNEADRCYHDMPVMDGFKPGGLSVGETLQIYYKLPGALGAGVYTVAADGVTTALDAQLHADLIHRLSGTSDVILGALDSTPPSVTDLQSQPWIRGTIRLPAIDGGSGDGLVLRIRYVSGGAPFSILETSMTIP
jgi:hypothetical protein